MVDSSIMTPELNTQTGDLVLRVCGTSRHGQVVRLKSTKCSIGSGRQCTLRLRAPGVQPIHCLVLRGANGSVIRRWSPDTRLNGAAFTDADLTPGDRITVGRVDLEVVDPGRLTRQPPRQFLPPPDSSLQEMLQSSRAELNQQKQQWEPRPTRTLGKLG